MNPRANPSDVSCQGKDKLTPARAHVVAEEMRRRGRKRVMPYHCTHCQQWHVGNSSGTLMDKRRQG